MSDNVVMFPGARRAPVVEEPERLDIEFPVGDGNTKKFTVDISDMYWWAPIIARTGAFSPSFEGVFYFYAEAYGWQNRSYDKRDKLIEMYIDRKTLESILGVVPYTFVHSSSQPLREDIDSLVNDNALIVVEDDLEIFYELGIFLSPTVNPDRFILNYVDCNNDR